MWSFYMINFSLLLYLWIYMYICVCYLTISDWTVYDSTYYSYFYSYTSLKCFVNVRFWKHLWFWDAWKCTNVQIWNLDTSVILNWIAISGLSAKYFSSNIQWQKGSKVSHKKKKKILIFQNWRANLFFTFGLKTFYTLSEYFEWKKVNPWWSVNHKISNLIIIHQISLLSEWKFCQTNFITLWYC